MSNGCMHKQQAMERKYSLPKWNVLSWGHKIIMKTKRNKESAKNTNKQATSVCISPGC